MSRKTDTLSHETLIEIGLRCNKLRGNHKKDRKTSLREFGEYLGISYSAISDIEAGKREMSIKELIAYQKQCNVSFDYLLGRIEDSSPDIEDMAIHKVTGLSNEAIHTLKFFYKDTGSFYPKIVSELIYTNSFGNDDDLSNTLSLIFEYLEKEELRLNDLRECEQFIEMHANDMGHTLTPAERTEEANGSINRDIVKDRNHALYDVKEAFAKFVECLSPDIIR